MSDLWPRIEPLLAKVEKPARYIGMERGSRQPAWAPSKAAWLLIYPDTYEIGLPNQGLQILYEILNERPDAVAERSYAPWTDLAAHLRARGIPLFSVDTHRPATDFDVLAFNLSAELVFTNVLELVDLAGVPVRNADRRPEHPIVLAGGHSAFNPEPLADYVDAFVIGEGEEVVAEITEVIGAWKRGGRADRDAVLHELATIPGVYVPSRPPKFGAIERQWMHDIGASEALEGRVQVVESLALHKDGSDFRADTALRPSFFDVDDPVGLHN